MLIVCPSCATSYTVEPASLGPAGRTVRCARCKESWFTGGPAETVSDFAADVIAEAEARETPEQPAGDDFGHEAMQPAAHISELHPADELPPMEPPALPVQEAPSIMPSMEAMPAAESPQDGIDSFSARRIRMHVRRKQKLRSSKWTAIILVLLGLNAGVYFGRFQIVHFFPQTASLFKLVGLDVNLRHLSFTGVKISREERDGVPVLAVEGTIVSQSSNPIEVPRLRFAVRNATGQEIYAWTSKPSRSILEPGDKLPFRSRLASPPADASDVLVRFANTNDVADK
jgi:predicted Zn finger-like uncharacterized protein